MSGLSGIPGSSEPSLSWRALPYGGRGYSTIQESFWGTLKAECASTPFATRTDARLAIFDYLEVWYNRQRLHSGLGYTSPANFERQHLLPFT